MQTSYPIEDMFGTPFNIQNPEDWELTIRQLFSNDKLSPSSLNLTSGIIEPNVIYVNEKRNIPSVRQGPDITLPYNAQGRHVDEFIYRLVEMQSKGLQEWQASPLLADLGFLVNTSLYGMKWREYIRDVRSLVKEETIGKLDDASRSYMNGDGVRAYELAKSVPVIGLGHLFLGVGF